MTLATKSLGALLRTAERMAGGSGLHRAVLNDSPAPVLPPPEVHPSSAAVMETPPPVAEDLAEPSVASPIPPEPSAGAAVQAEVGDRDATIRLGDRTWRARGLARNPSVEGLKVNLMVRRQCEGGETHPTTTWLYDGDDLAAEYDGLGNLLRRYVHADGADTPLVWFEGSGTSAPRYLYADHQGSIVAVANAVGAVTTVNGYDEYGIPNAANAGRFQYTGQAWLPELGMHHYKARIYSPTLGRFLQTDPIGYDDQINLYAYVGNDPVNKIDPMGKQAATITGAGAGCVVTGPACPAGATVGAVGGLIVDGITIAIGACALSEGCRNWVGDRAAEVGEFSSNIFENRSREPDPLPEAEGRPHSRPDGNDGYTEYGPNDPQTGRPTGTRQYRPAPGRPHGDVPRPNVKERPPMPRPDGTIQPGRP